jgi:hypothetical protein
VLNQARLIHWRELTDELEHVFEGRVCGHLGLVLQAD